MALLQGHRNGSWQRQSDPPIDATAQAKGFGVAAERVDTAAGFDAALAKSFAKTDGPSLIEVMVKS